MAKHEQNVIWKLMFFLFHCSYQCITLHQYYSDKRVVEKANFLRRIVSVTIFECHLFPQNSNFLSWILTNSSRRRAYADENVS